MSSSLSPVRFRDGADIRSDAGSEPEGNQSDIDGEAIAAPAMSPLTTTGPTTTGGPRSSSSSGAAAPSNSRSPSRRPTTPSPVQTNKHQQEGASPPELDETPTTVQCPPIIDIVDCPRGSKENSTSLPCRDCAEQPWIDTYHASSDDTSLLLSAAHNETSGAGPIYLPLLVPPFFGSSVLENILSSSPAVSNMCQGQWQCESTKLLSKRDHAYRWDQRWDPRATNWTHVYDLYRTQHFWQRPEAPVLMDKAPPNIAKIKGLVEYFETHNLNYRFVVMWRHPCLEMWYDAHKGTIRSKQRTDRHAGFLKNVQESYTVYLRDVLTRIPKDRRFFINYHDLLTRPSAVLAGLLDWLPVLDSLTIDTYNLQSPHGRRAQRRQRSLNGMHGSSLRSYVFDNDKCFHKVKRDVVPTEEMNLWGEYADEVETCYRHGHFV